MRRARGGAPRGALVALGALVASLGVSPAAAQAPGAPARPGGPATPSDALRAGNAAAIEGDWVRVSMSVDPLLRAQLSASDRAEAHRLAGLAALFQGRRLDAEEHFLTYLRLDLDGQLDPALYPPEAITFFSEVRARHEAELRARRPKAKRYWVLNLVPPWGQFQNGERTKGYVIGGLLAGFAVANVTSYLVLRSWCTEVRGDGGLSVTCDEGTDRTSRAAQLQSVNLVSGIGVFAMYAYGVYDGVSGYRRTTRERTLQPFVTTSPTSGFVGVAGTF